MNKLNLNHFVITTSLIGCLLIPSVAKSCGDNDTGVDPALHVSLSAIAGYIGESYVHTNLNTSTQRVLIGTAIGSIPGLIKEVVDYAENDEYCAKDMFQNIGGALAGSLIANSINSKKYGVTFNKHQDDYYVGLIFKD